MTTHKVGNLIGSLPRDRSIENSLRRWSEWHRLNS